ncbi:EP1-like glycoprotein 2 [Phoenix dactylifera]|uniref:EP1-like glycoprotein 2 n=1 Tax=Phoenix dactylifera TaxID=42345 RepID=A0A8B7D2Y8_PHODC|nr:EP1-like glycoprotein 2 [Phoenix dactylifera]
MQRFLPPTPPCQPKPAELSQFSESMASPFPASLFSLPLLLFFLSTTIAHAKVQTFSYVNEGEFGPYITEYDANYRVLPIAASPFQMAFYNTTPNAFYLALRMGTTRSESTFRWVWEANRGRPVRENATFSLLSDGNLVLADAERRVVWSTGTANKGVVGLKILPSGNIVLYNAKGRFLWQSFDHPTDTLLVGQSLYVGGPTKLVSRKSTTDGSFGNYILVLESGGLAMYINDLTPKPLPYYNYSDGILGFSGNSVKLESEPETEDAFAYEVRLVENQGTIILARPKYNATLSFLRLDVDGNLVVYTYYDPVDYRAWEETFAFFSDEIGRLSGCALPSKCGDFGVCEDDMCVACPSPTGLLGWSKGCAQPSLRACKGGAGVGYYKVVAVENFLTSYSEGEGVVKVEECKRRCGLDCECVGFLYWEKESRCWLAPVLGTLAKVDDSLHVAYVKYIK